MFIEGMCLRNGFKDINVYEVEFPAELQIEAEQPGGGLLGKCSLERRDDGNLWAGFYLSEMDVDLLPKNCYFALALESDAEGHYIVVGIALTDRNIDPEIPPIEAY